jgi:hypothetical protein
MRAILFAAIAMLVACGPDKAQVVESIDQCRRMCHNHGAELIEIGIDTGSGWIRGCLCSVPRSLPEKIPDAAPK